MIDLGAAVPIATVLTDASGTEVNASTAVLTITLPDGTTTTPTVPAPSVPGHYQVDYLTTQAGRHAVRWLFTGPNTAVTDAFDVAPADPGFIVSLADARAHLNKATTADDDEIRTFIEAATEVIENDPEIGVGPVVVRSYTERHRSQCYLTLHRVPVVSLTSVTPWLNTGTAYDVDDLRVDERTGRVERRDGGWLSGGPFAVTYRAGRSTVSANIRLAALEMIKHWWESQRGPAVGGRPPLSGEPTVTVSSGYAIPTRVAQMLRAERSFLGFA